jgi:DNA ligase-1
MGALVCQDCVTGEEFRIGTGFSDAQRENPPKINSTVTYAYQELTDSKKPRFPVFLR